MTEQATFTIVKDSELEYRFSRKWTQNNPKTLQGIAAIAASIVRGDVENGTHTPFTVWDQGFMVMERTPHRKLRYDADINPGAGKYICTAIKNARSNQS